MIVEFMQNFSDSEHLYKNTSVLYTANCKMLYPCTAENPSFTIDYQSLLSSCNYLHVPELTRYYYATPTLLNGNRMQFDCKVDVLMSYQSQIAGISANISFSNSSNRKYVPDSRIAMENSVDIQVIQFPFSLGNSDFSGVHYLMSVIGGAESVIQGGA